MGFSFIFHHHFFLFISLNIFFSCFLKVFSFTNHNKNMLIFMWRRVFCLFWWWWLAERKERGAKKLTAGGFSLLFVIFLSKKMCGEKNHIEKKTRSRKFEPIFLWIRENFHFFPFVFYVSFAFFSRERGFICFSFRRFSLHFRK